MLTKPPARVIAALNSLEGNADFEEICTWLNVSLSDIRKITDSTRDEVQTRWNQGAAQALEEFLVKKATARETLQRMR
jgi:hypothetical protein